MLQEKYPYTNDLLSLQVSTPAEISLPECCCAIASPLRFESWRKYLAPHPDRNYVTYLLDGIRCGFRIGCFSSVSLHSAVSNMRGATEHSAVVEKYLREERSAGRIVSVPPEYHSVVHVSRFGVIPKKHQPGEWRLIVDLSSPEGHSVNDFIHPSLCSLKYASVDDVAEFVLRSGRGSLLAKLDIKHAYRNIPIHPSDRHLLGMQLQLKGDVVVDTCLPFGLRSAPKIFNATADALEWMIAHYGSSHVEFIVHYLDDFLVAGRPDSDSCKRSLDLALQFCQEVGFPVKDEKVVGPTTVIEFLGISIDTDVMELRLPPEKLHRLKQLVQAWLGKKSCTKRQLLSLIGYLRM